jgi:hypothetical protein
MRSENIQYAGVIGAVAGVLGLFGVYAVWWQVALPENQVIEYKGTAHVSGDVALWASIALFVFSCAYILFSDPAIRRAMGALLTVSAVVLTAAAVIGFYSGDDVAANTTIESGLWVSGLSGLLGICAGLLALQRSMMPAEGSTATDERREMPPPSQDTPSAP